MEKKQTHIPYGFITALVMVVVTALLEVTKLSDKTGMQWISVLVFAVGIIMNARAYSAANDANVTFGQVFGSCFKASAIVALVMMLWGYLSFMIFPGMEARMIEKMQQDMADNSKISEEQAEKTVKWMQEHLRLMIVGGALFGMLLYGVISSLIGAAIAKKAPRQQFDIQ